MPRSIDEIEPDISPFKMGDARFNRNPPFPFFRKIIHCGKAIFDIARATDFTCGKQDSLGKGRLARIDMCEDCDVSNGLHILKLAFLKKQKTQSV